MSLRIQFCTLMVAAVIVVLLLVPGVLPVCAEGVAQDGTVARQPSGSPRERGGTGDLGIACSPVTAERLDSLRVSQGVVVDQVFQARAGEKAGLQANDVIQKVNGREVESPDELSAALRAAGAGARVSLSVVRDGHPLELTATVGEAPIALMRSLTGHQGGVNAVAFSPDGKILATGSSDRTVRLWDVEAGRLLRTLEGHSAEVQSVAFSPDGAVLASCGGEVRLWNAQTGALKRAIKLTAAVNAVAFSPDGKLLATAGSDHAARLWDPETGILQRSLIEHACSRVSWVGFSPDGQTLATATVGGDEEDTAAGELLLWDPRTGERKRSLIGGDSPWDCAAFSPDGKSLVAGTAGAPDGRADGPLCLWDTTTGEVKRSLQLNRSTVEAISFSPSGQLLASGDYSRDAEDRTVASLGVWDARTGRLKLRFTVDPGFLSAVAFSPDGKTLATAGSARVVKLWRLGE